MKVFDKRKKIVEGLVRDLLTPRPFTAALVKDGWSLAMAKEGLKLHSRTWNGLESVRAQLESIEGKKKVKEVCHVWPALPGAGVSPVLFGLLAGVEKQVIKPSRRGIHFATYFTERAKEHGVSLCQSQNFSTYERLIVSGSDETLAHFSHLNEALIGFGHRESIAVLDESFCDFSALARDITQWNQQGCFSVRAVFFMGKDEEGFSRKLARALSLGSAATTYGEGELVSRIQKRAILEMSGRLVIDPAHASENIPWVERCQGSWKGGSPAPGCVGLYVSPDSEALFRMIDIPSYQRQGVALKVQYLGVGGRLEKSGFTLIGKVGEMQSPPLSWRHDGRSNVEMFVA